MPDPSNRRVLLSIISVISVYGITIGFMYPLISLKMELMGFPPSLIGLMGTLPFLASVIASPIVPIIMRRFKVSRLVFIAICFDLVMILTMAIWENVNVWFVCRFLMGIAGTVLFVVSETWINEIADDRFRGQILGLYTFAFSATLGLSPMFILIFGVEGRMLFFIAIVVVATGLIPLRWTRDSTPDFSGGKVTQIVQFMILAPTLVAACALMSFEEAAVITLLPVYALRNGLTEGTSAVMLTVLAIGSMLAQPIVGRLADKMNRYRLLIACAAIVFLGAFSLPLIIKSSIAIWLVLLIWGGAIAGIYTLALTIMGQRFRGSQLAAGNAAFGLMWGLAGALAPWSSGIAMTAWGANGFVIVLCLAVFAFLILALVRLQFRSS